MGSARGEYIKCWKLVVVPLVGVVPLVVDTNGFFVVDLYLVVVSLKEIKG